MNSDIRALGLAGAFTGTYPLRGDHRGSFMRLYEAADARAMGVSVDPVQVNLSRTASRGTVRGMHFQHPPYSETKIIHCISGAVHDVMVDLRAGSPTFLQYEAVELSEENRRYVVIPRGFAHGFQALTDHVEMIYLHDNVYHPAAEGIVSFKDPRIGIEWPLPIGEVSSRDLGAAFLLPDFKGLTLA